MRAAVALDIDGTLTTACPREVRRLSEELRRRGVGVYVNTARPAAYCEAPSAVSTQVAPTERHLCLADGDPPASKVKNMRAIQAASGAPARCIVLVDDRPENVDAVRAGGFAGVLVDEASGIRKETVEQCLRIVDSCCGSSPRAPRRADAALRGAVAILAVLLLCVALLR